MTDKKKFCTIVFHDSHVVCELTEKNTYKCIPELSNGNLTDMTFATESESNIARYKVKFYDTLDEARKNKRSFNHIKAAQAEDDYLMGRTDMFGNENEEF